MGGRVLITGGAGYVGSHCVRHLLEEGYQILVYDNLSSGHRGAVANVELVVGDLADTKLVEETINTFKPEAVMHFAALIRPAESVKQPLKYYQNNVCNTVRLLDIIKCHGIRKFVFSSSCAVYGNPPTVPIVEDMSCNPLSPYGQTKLMVEKLLADCSSAWGLSFASLRYFNAAGAALDGSIGEDHCPEIHLVPLVVETAMGKRDRISVFGTDYDTPDGTCIRDYVHVEDLAQAHRAALEKLEGSNNLICNLGTGRGHSVLEVIKTVEEVSGRKVKVKPTSRRPGDPAVLYADASRAKKLLGWEAKIVDLKDIIASAWHWHTKCPDGFED